MACRAFAAAATAICANEHDFDVKDPPELPFDERDFLTQHLQYSLYLKELWKRGDAIIEGIFNRKRGRKRLLRDRTLRMVVRTIRRFARYDTLRSTLEGLLFEQVPFLGLAHPELTFTIKSIKNVDLSLTQVYFNTNVWDPFQYEREVAFDMCEELTHSDIAKILFFFGVVMCTVSEMREFLLTNVRCHSSISGAFKWKQRALKNMSSILKKQRMVTSLLIELLPVVDRDGSCSCSCSESEENGGLRPEQRAI